jgi:hypothetical protein
MMIGPSLALPAVRRGGGVTFVAPAINSTVTLGSVGVGAGGVGTYFWKGTLTAVATGAAQVLLQVDDGSTSNRYLMSNTSASAFVQVIRVTGGASSGANAGTASGGTEFKCGMSVAADGTALASFNGGAAVSVTGGPTSGLTTLRFGAAASGSMLMAGTIAIVRVLAGVALDAASLDDAVLAL